ncbi:dTMP kinase [Catellatospora aurea]|uniref:Thymidylate kinase n=1 Tax=Catellatospora aurea TaxID=1337874 RepID=A0ABW2GVU2_9ACTN
MAGTSASVVALVGIDGSGKTTQAVRLAAALCAAGVTARYGRNAGGRRFLGRVARKLGRDDAVSLLGRRGLLTIEAVLRWLAIARSLLTARLTGAVAVMDRYTPCQLVSIRAHEGGEWLARTVRAAYAPFPRPAVIIFLDVPPEVAYHRVEQRGDDHEDIEYLNASYAAYKDVLSDAVHVDGSGDPDAVAQAVWAVVWPVVKRGLAVDVGRS